MMFFYLIRIALKNLRRNPVLSTLMIGAIGLGIGVSTTFVTSHYFLSMNPIPHKSEILYYVEMDNWDPNRGWDDDDPTSVPNQLTYRDMVGIMASDIPTHQGGSFKASVYVFPNSLEGRPYGALSRMCFNDFFVLFDVPFKYGSAWEDSADQGPEPVIVLGSESNQKLFGGENSVGEMVRIEDRQFKVVGVLDSWRPMPKYYDPHNGPFQKSEDFYLPFEFFQPMKLNRAGNTSAWKGWDTWEDFLVSEAIWIQFWVQLDSEPQKESYMDFLDSYVGEQKNLGRMLRPTNNKLLNVMEWLEEREAVPEVATSLMIISVFFLLICALNLIGILLGKFLARAPEISVRRAMGASRRSIFIQHIIECEIIGILGGILGVLLSLLGLQMVNSLFTIPFNSRLDTNMLGVAIILALLAGLVAGLYPAWRICTIPPANYLREQ
jgi:putative ABC transport system permease protein